ncbi:uncharacterized protein LOC129788434 [Lutzomyia longipalpis]|uniref:uncharacterized protein LOC129788434 n=1 Tax=Lutzomyia longipalpis TaxID=7200 RepID=UPI002483CA6E|nr:uncharacterized protein LOC129788434 [Lutzomyia longipalpis]XP_055680489.1 uncharacterized protein LOC129788434 [Lutzomyia longipalpis]
MNTILNYHHKIRVLLLVSIFADMVNSLRDVYVTVPNAVRRGDTTLLICHYDLEGDALYSVKWYKGRQEFYGYTPKEMPTMKIFSIAGISIIKSLSNESHITLEDVQLISSGRYSCEVTVDAPSFHTFISSADMEVVELPHHLPAIVGTRPKYRVRDSVRANCTSRLSKPAANLTWSINNLPVNPSYVKYHKPLKNHEHALETAIIGIQFVINRHHFIDGKLKLKCLATIHDIYIQSTEKSLEEEKPRIHSTRTPNVNYMNFHLNFPHDRYPTIDTTDSFGRKNSYETEFHEPESSYKSSSAYRACSPLKYSVFTIVIHCAAISLTSSNVFIREIFNKIKLSSL